MHAMSRLSDAHLITVISLAGGNYGVISDIGDRQREREREREQRAPRSRTDLVASEISPWTRVRPYRPDNKSDDELRADMSILD